MTDYLLQEDGSYLLQEDEDKIILDARIRAKHLDSIVVLVRDIK